MSDNNSETATLSSIKSVRFSETTININDTQNEKEHRNIRRGSGHKKPAQPKRLEFDNILPLAGEFGWYQGRLLIISVPYFVMLSCIYFSQLFMTKASNNHWCWVPELANLTSTERRNLAIPSEKNKFGYSRCTMYSANWSEVLKNKKKPVNSKIVPCHNGWEFDQEIPYKTITSELSWVCSKESYPAAAQGIFFAGSIIGGFLIGWVADAFGRVTAVTISSMFALFGSAATITSKNFAQFAVFRFITGIANDSIVNIVYVILLEYSSTNFRTIMANFPFAFFYGSATTLLPWISLWCFNWKTFAAITSLPFLIGCLAPLYFPESSRWYLTKGRVDEAVIKLAQIGYYNDRPIPLDILVQYKVSKKKTRLSDTKTHPSHLITRPTMRRLTCLTCFLFIANSIAFDGLLRIVNQLGSNFFLSFTLVSLTEIPPAVLIIFILDLFGRRWLSVICLSICCVFTILTAFVPNGVPQIVCAMIARFSVNMSYCVVIQWAAELFPTSLRGIAVSTVHVSGLIGTLISPYIAVLESYLVFLPLLVIGIGALLGGFFALFLPETTGKNMPFTIEDSENLVKQQLLLDPPMFLLQKLLYENSIIDK